MKKQRILYLLVTLIAVLTLVAAGAGLFWGDTGTPFTFKTLHGQTTQMYGQGIYRNDTYFQSPIFRGTDTVALFFFLPLLILSFALYWRASLRGWVLLVGTLGFFLYYSMSIVFSAAFNSLFLVYTALFSASFFTFVVALTAVDPQILSAHLSPQMPRRGTAAFMFVAGLGVFFIWLSEIIGPIMLGQVPAEILGPYTTLVTHAFDLAIIAPTVILTGTLLLRREPLGYLLAAPLLILCTLIGVVVITQTIFQAMAGIILPKGAYVGLVGSWVLLGAWAIWLTVAFFRNLNEPSSKPSIAAANQANLTFDR